MVHRNSQVTVLQKIVSVQEYASQVYLLLYVGSHLLELIYWLVYAQL